MVSLGSSVYSTCSFRLQLYEQILAENEKLKAQLRDTELELSDLKLQLEKATQVSSFSERVLYKYIICTKSLRDLFTLSVFWNKNTNHTTKKKHK